ncbi:MAG: threonine/serine dehydratase [Ignavibacteriae bacterium]|nr:MAG: threonine/serine dehydratase [Ignavibacteriota bacterium]
MISIEDITLAYRNIKPVVHHTPLLTSRWMNEQCGSQVFFKAENFQRIGAFKIRGAYNKILSLSPEEKRRGIVAHSSGNHAQGVALAARLLYVKAVVVMPKNSPHIKVEATQSYGAEVVFCEDSSDDRERVAAALQKEFGYAMVPPFDDDKIIAGQGTVMVEVAEELDSLDYLFVPVGGGGLISGCAVAARHYFPGIRIIGVETEPANDGQQSFRKKEIVRIAPPATIADGMRTQSVGRRNFEIIMKYVDDMVTVTDAQVIDMMRLLMQRMKIIVEPTGAVAPAAAFRHGINGSGKNICAIISGGNVEPSLLKQWL